MKCLEGKTAIVTGGSQNLGKAIALRLAAEGASVSIFDLNDEKGRETAEEISKQFGKAHSYAVDVSRSDRVNAAVADVQKREGKIDILVNCAGIVSTHDNLLSVTDEIWDREIGVNLTGTFNCCRAVLHGMIEKKYGKIVNIASLAGETGRPQTSPAYSAAKAGVMGLTRSIAYNVAKHGINANAVSPGVILTGIHATYPKEVLDRLIAQIPYVRGGKMDDIAGAVLFLACSDSDYITGETIKVNGGSLIF
jgi:NAD(P)-dependent dehydrogenase (short-subunit alcohol dehydrogenase family)